MASLPLFAQNVAARWRKLPGFLVFLALGGRAVGQPVSEAARKAGWHTDYQAAKAEARRSGKPLFVVFRCQP